jgi:single-stranded-DNA-specific exonuclease RecJ
VTPSRSPNQRWQIAPADPDRAAKLAQAVQLPLLVAQVLLNRGVDTPEAARTFLEPELQLLPSPLDEFPDLPIALEILLNAISSRQYIAICGDYDADGMTSTALLMRTLRYLGANVDYAIPSRMQEGYGINRRIVEEFYEQGVSVILTVDNGIAAHEPIARARELGITVIVTDHHDIPPTLPQANAILNPKLIRETSPYYGVAGVGVAYILAICLSQCLQRTQDLTTPLLELFTLGTIADLAPLTGVNRRWVKRGLRLLPKSRLPGVQALIQVAGLSNEKALKPEAIGFRLGPRINAIGRLADPQIVIELLTTEDDGQALELAMKCEQVNQLRQRLCELIEQEAIAWCEQTRFQPQQERVLVIVQPSWHHGVIGIVASRLVERYGVPVFIGTYEHEDQQQVRGSARSIPEFNVFEALQFCGDILEKFGGHRAAGGFSLQSANLEEMRSRLRLFAHNQLQPEHLKPLVTIDVQADFRDITHELFNELDALHPCGIENPDPVFWTPNVRIIEQQTIGRDRTHLKLTLAQANDPTVGIRALAWRWGEYYPLPERVDVAYRLRLNEWNGVRSVELELAGVRLIQSSPAAFRPIVAEVSSSPAFPDSNDLEPDLPKLNFAKEFAEEIDLENELDEERTEEEISKIAEPESPAKIPVATVQPETPIEFYYNSRKYYCGLISNTTDRVLKIRNCEGQMLTIQPEQRRGWMSDRIGIGETIDLSQSFYFNLVRAASNALEIAEKDQQIASLHQTIDLLAQEVETWKTRFHQAEAQLAQKSQVLQSSLPPEPPNPSNSSLNQMALLQIQTPSVQVQDRAAKQDIKQQVIDRVGTVAWGSIRPQSQKELVSVAKQTAALLEPIADYSQFGLLLCGVIDREIVQLFFQQLQQYLSTQIGVDSIADIPLRSRKKYTLNQLIPLLGNEWSAFREEVLQCTHCPDEYLYDDVTCDGVSRDDRQTVFTFLNQWQHPLAKWLLQPDSISQLSQIDQLKTIAANPDSVLPLWQFELLQGLILGSEERSGILLSLVGNN